MSAKTWFPNIVTFRDTGDQDFNVWILEAYNSTHMCWFSLMVPYCLIYLVITDYMFVMVLKILFSVITWSLVRRHITLEKTVCFYQVPGVTARLEILIAKFKGWNSQNYPWNENSSYKSIQGLIYLWFALIQILLLHGLPAYCRRVFC